MRLRYTRQDMIRASLVHAWHRAVSPKSLALSLIAAMGISLLVTWLGHGHVTVSLWLGGTVVMLAFIALGWALHLLYALWWGARMLDRHPHLRHDFDLSVTNDGVLLGGEHGDWTYPWTDFTGLAEGRDHMVLLLGPTLFLALPRRALDPALQAQVRQMTRR